MTSPFHDGELAVQERAGVRPMAARIGRSIDDQIDAGVAQFLAQRYSLYVGSLDADQRPWASQLIGPPGFVTAVDSRTVRIEAQPPNGDPLLEHLRATPAIALLAIDLPTRRRFRINGSAKVAAGTIEVSVREAFGNCPKYIQRREPVDVAEPQPASPMESRTLPPAAQSLIEAADTFFIATTHKVAGVDVSHRGGRPGFVRVVDTQTLEWPDYQGNMMFQSLGNISVDAHAGLLFVDFTGESLLQLSGHAEIIWDLPAEDVRRGAQRLIRFAVERVRQMPHGNPLLWQLIEPSPHNP